MATLFSACTSARYGELLGAVLSGEVAPVCPVSFWMHHPGLDQDSKRLADATCEFQQAFDLDFVKLTPASTYQLIDHGTRDCLAGDTLGRRVVVGRVISHPEDWLRLEPQRMPGEFAGRIVSAAALVRRRVPRSVPVIATVFNPLFQAVSLAGIEALRLHASERPDLLNHGLSVLTASTRNLIQSYRDAGVDGIFLASQHATASTFEWDAYLKWGLAGDSACLDAAHGMLSFYHLHGDGIFANLVRMVAPSVLHYDTSPGNPPPDLLLSEGRVSVATGLDLSMASPYAEPGEAVDCVRARLDRWQGPRFILTPGCALPLDTPPSLLRAAVDAAREERRGRECQA